MGKTCGALPVKKERSPLRDFLSYWHTNVDKPENTHMIQLSVDIDFSLENLLRAMENRDRWWEGERERESDR